jgi:hypothetical protein
MGIVKVPFLVILENIVGLLDGFEARFCFFSVLLGDFVGVT